MAEALAEQAWVLCFDEFTVTDIADAMILSRLFNALFARGVVLIATSNVAPDNLYRDGLNRQLFLPFVDILKQHVDVINLDSRTDYRLEKLDRQPVYLTPLGSETAKRMDAARPRIRMVGKKSQTWCISRDAIFPCVMQCRGRTLHLR